MIQPISIGYLIGHFDSPSTTDSYTATVAAIALLLSSLLCTIGMHQYMLGQVEIGFKIRVAVTTIIYSKVHNRNENHSKVNSNIRTHWNNWRLVLVRWILKLSIILLIVTVKNSSFILHSIVFDVVVFAYFIYFISSSLYCAILIITLNSLWIFIVYFIQKLNCM